MLRVIDVVNWTEQNRWNVNSIKNLSKKKKKKAKIKRGKTDIKVQRKHFLNFRILIFENSQSKISTENFRHTAYSWLHKVFVDLTKDACS